MLRSICNQSGESVESVLINYYLFIKLSVLAAVLADWVMFQPSDSDGFWQMKLNYIAVYLMIYLVRWYNI